MKDQHSRGSHYLHPRTCISRLSAARIALLETASNPLDLLKKAALSFLICLGGLTSIHAQGPDENQVGAWYMYFWSMQIGESNWGLQGDYQYRDWIGLGDREQLLLRTGFTYTPDDSGVKFTLGYGNITTGQYGEEDEPVMEHRIYQEALFGQTLLKRFLLTHRIRYEQRFVENQDLRTRYRYNLFVNIPFKGTTLSKGTPYAAFYNEIFINGETEIGDNRTVQFFDRNRTYMGVGYVARDNMRFQLGWMNQTTTAWKKAQFQLSMHHSF